MLGIGAVVGVALLGFCAGLWSFRVKSRWCPTAGLPPGLPNEAPTASNDHAATPSPVDSRPLRTPEPKPGDVLLISREASVQFAGDRRLTFRVISVDPKPTYHGWVWLTGYIIDERGYAAERREIFVQ